MVATTPCLSFHPVPLRAGSDGSFGLSEKELGFDGAFWNNEHAVLCEAFSLACGAPRAFDFALR